MREFKEKLPNNRSNFLCEELEGYIYSNNYEEVFNLNDVNFTEYYKIDENNKGIEKDKVLNLLALAYNQKGDYDKAKDLLVDKKPELLEGLVLEEILKLNLLEVDKGIINEKQGIINEVDRYDLDIYLEFIKIINNIRKNEEIDNIKTINQLIDKINELIEIDKKNNGGSHLFILVVASLFKARSLRANGNFKDSLVTYDNIFKKFNSIRDSRIKNIILVSLLEKAIISRDLNNLNEALDDISIAEIFIKEKSISKGKYNLGNEIKLELLKVEIEMTLKEVDLSSIEKVNNLIKYYEEEYGCGDESYRLILNKILTKNELDENKIENSLKLLSESKDTYEKNKSIINQKYLAEIIYMIKNSIVANKDYEEEYVKLLSNDMSIFLRHEDKELDILGALSLKELAEFYLEKENEVKIKETSDKYLQNYMDSSNEKVAGYTDYFKLLKGELLFEEGRYEDTKDLVKSISRDKDSEILVKRELLIANSDYNLSNIDEAISQYEYYLNRFKDIVDDEVREDIYWKLVNLFLRVNEKDKVISYLDKILAEDYIDVKKLEAYLIKGDIISETDKKGGEGIYLEGIEKYYINRDRDVQDLLVKLLSRVAINISDLEPLKEVVENATSDFDDLGEEVKMDLFLTLKNIAYKMEKEGNYDNEDLFRKLELEYFKDKKGMEIEREIAKSYYRTLINSIDNRDSLNRDLYFTGFYDYLKNKKEPLLVEYFTDGMNRYFGELYKIGELDKVSSVLDEFLLENDSVEGKYYKGKLLKDSGKDEEALKYFDEVIDLAEGELFFDSILEKIDIIKKEKTFMNRSIKKLIGEVRENYVKKMEKFGESYMLVSLLYSLGELYELINKEEKGREIFRETIKRYGNESDYRIVEELKKHYDKLNIL